jgi:SAM-dependent methyltransferase
MSAPKHLILGAGWRDHIHPENTITLDINPDVEPDILHDLEVFPYPFDDEEFDSITAHQVLEHTGTQGDHRFFFAQFSEFYRILKPNGRIIADVPRWDRMWAFGDPSHKRIINEGTLAFLDQQEYIDQCGKTPMTDFRRIYQADFSVAEISQDEGHLYFTLVAIKPSRYKR